MMLRKFMENRQAFVITTAVACLILGGSGLVVGAIILLYILSNLVNIGLGLMMIVVPIFLIVVMLVLVKFLLTGKYGGKK